MKGTEEIIRAVEQLKAERPAPGGPPPLESDETVYPLDAGDAIDRAYEAVRLIHFKDMYYRTDIGAKSLAMSS